MGFVCQSASWSQTPFNGRFLGDLLRKRSFGNRCPDWCHEQFQGTKRNWKLNSKPGKITNWLCPLLIVCHQLTSEWRGVWWAVQITKCRVLYVVQLHGGKHPDDAASVMQTSRCAQLMLIAAVNKLSEVWISRNPFLLYLYYAQYFPAYFLR